MSVLTTIMLVGTLTIAAVGVTVLLITGCALVYGLIWLAVCAIHRWGERRRKKSGFEGVLG